MHLISKKLCDVVSAFFVGVFCVFCQSPAYAQRGSQMPLPNSDVPPATANDGFPGFFDTNMANTNSFVFDVPTFNFDYGVNEKLTIGANGIGALFLVTTFTPILSAKLRYRLFSTENMRDTLTVYGTYAKLRKTPKNPSTMFEAVVMTNNFTYYFNERSQIYASTLVGRLQYTESVSSEIDYQKLSLTPVIVSVGYQHFFTERLGLSPLLIYNFLSKVQLDSAQAAVSTSNSAAASSSNLMIRVNLDVKLGDSFLLSAYQLSTFTDEGLSSLPWVSFMYRW